MNGLKLGLQDANAMQIGGIARVYEYSVKEPSQKKKTVRGRADPHKARARVRASVLTMMKKWTILKVAKSFFVIVPWCTALRNALYYF